MEKIIEIVSEKDEQILEKYLEKSFEILDENFY
jgi:hypothetical protein